MDFDKILATIKPTKAEEQQLQQVVKSIISKIRIPGAVPMLGGSGAKNTWLKGTHDIDIYVKFNYKKFQARSDHLADLLEKHLKKHFKIERLHGSRDYFQMNIPPYTVEIVPILDIKKASQAKNITDFSHLHVQYVQKHKKLADDIRLAKLFTKAQGVYGAESYIQGLSGYVLELLVIYYGSFMNMIRAAAKWKNIALIGNKKDAAKLNPAKKISPLILLDPVQPDRNAAAALSQEKYKRFIKACKLFVKRPSEKYFEEQEVNFEALKKKGKVIYCAVEPLAGKKDVAGAKMLKAFEYIHDQLKQHGFNLIQSGWQYEHPSFLYFVVDRKPLSQTMLHPGPPLKHREGAKHFVKQHKRVITKNNRLYAEVPREFLHAEDCLQTLFHSPNVQERVAAIRLNIL